MSSFDMTKRSFTLVFPLLGQGVQENFDPLGNARIIRLQNWFRHQIFKRRRKFFAAAEFGLIGIMTNCLKKRQNINERNPEDICNLKRPALHIAAGAGMTEAVRFLLDNGASALVLDEKGMTALHYASQNTPESISRLLNSAATNTWKQSYVTGEPPAGCLEIARMLVRRQPKSVESVNYDGQTALHLACSHGLHTVATVLLCEGDADPDIRDGMNRCALHLSAWRGDYEVTRVLLEHSEESEALYARNAIGRTPLHVAAVYGHTRVAKLLLEAGAPHDVINNNGNTPLHLSLLDGFWETADLLLDYGAETHLPNCNGETAIWIAVEKKQSQLALKMLDKRRIIRNSVGLFGYSTEITYDMRALNSAPERVNVGYDITGVGEVHPQSHRASEMIDNSSEPSPKLRQWSDPGLWDTRKDSVSISSAGSFLATVPGANGALSSPRLHVTSAMFKSGSSGSSTPAASSPNTSNKERSTSFALPVSLFNIFVSKLTQKKRDGAATPTARRKGSLRQVGLALEQSALRRIAETNNKEIISHPVIVRLLEWQWQKFARRVHMKHLLQQVVFTLLWTICTLIGGGPWGSTPDFSHPDFDPGASNSQGGGAQIVFTALMVLMMVYMLGVVLQRELSSLAIEMNSRLTVGGDVSFSRGLMQAILAKHDFWFVYDIFLFGLGTALVLICEIRALTKTDNCRGCWEMSRVVFGIISVFVWGRFLQFFSSDRRTGPFIKVIAVMFQKDIRNFFTIYFVVLLAFSHGFFILLTGLVPNHIDTDQYATTAFDNPVKTVMAVYRLMLGDYQSMYERYETIPSDAVVISTTIMYFAYMTFANVLMLNLLIAMLDETYTEHKREMEKEWRLQWAKRILSIEDSIVFDKEESRVPAMIEVSKDDLASELQREFKSAIEQRMSALEENQLQTNALLKSLLSRAEARDERAALNKNPRGIVLPESVSSEKHRSGGKAKSIGSKRSAITPKGSSTSNKGHALKIDPFVETVMDSMVDGASVFDAFGLSAKENKKDGLRKYLEDQIIAQQVQETNKALDDFEREIMTSESNLPGSVENK